MNGAKIGQRIADLNQRATSVTFAPMNFFLASLAWLVIAFLLAVGIWLAAVKGVAWFLIAFVVVFVLTVWRIGCRAH